MAAVFNRVVARLPVPVRNGLWALGLRFGRFEVRAYAQEGEDRILARLFENAPPGLYVDVGAHHPTRYSNTYIFYQRGWHGINIDAMPGSMAAFRRQRARDVNVEAAISSQPGQELTFYIFNDPALNTTDARLADERCAAGFRLVRTQAVVTRTLADVLRAHLPPGERIVFLSVDVEGLDLDVLRSNDWASFRPQCVLVECPGTSIPDVMAGDVHAFMQEQGYVFFAKTVNTAIFIDSRAPVPS